MLSDDILAGNTGAFGAMVGHRFVHDIMADRLGDAVFRRYLVYEAGFVDTAIAIFALAVAKAPSIVSRRWLIGVLDALANEQTRYFERSFAALGINPASVPGDPRVAAFNDGMRSIAEQGGYAEIITAMFGAEWMYWTWCHAADRCRISNHELKAWVSLHAAAGFADQALWLKRELDILGQSANAADRDRLSKVFAETMALEIAFHEAAYGP